MADFIEFSKPLTLIDEHDWPHSGEVYIEPGLNDSEFRFYVSVAKERIVAGFNFIEDARFFAAIFCALDIYENPGE